MHVVKFGVLLVACLGVASCLTAPTRSLEAPCFDGWSTDRSGKSKVWTPSDAQVAALDAIRPNKEPAACYHLMPSGQVTVLTIGADAIHSYTAAPADSGFELLSTGTLVSTH